MPVPPPPPSPLRVLVAIAAVEGLAFVAYTVYLVVEAFTVGITGPSDVSNPGALILLIVLTALVGAALLWMARAWWLVRQWVRTPFVLAQVILGLLGYEASQGTGIVEMVGGAAVIVAVVGIVLAVLPRTGRVLASSDA